MDFARRARKLYGDREAIVDGDLRLTYRSSLIAVIAGPRVSNS